ncbi:ATP-binding protein [Actinoplanes sp. NPDC020271]|uniref:ATP-binding protein n=1 Tax=Actinoplanes sp. NPDC020271 TaxID=3363896 RepID=UPI0037B2E032
MATPGPASSGGDGLSLWILGPLRIWRDGAEVPIPPRHQAHLLALLLARAGRSTSTDELIDLLWQHEPPVSAVNALHRYVGALRRLLEPGLPARAAGSYLTRRGSGYLIEAGPGTLDLIAFRRLVSAAAESRAAGCPEAALDAYAQALKLWNGPAGDGLRREPALAAVFAALDEDFLSACRAAAELARSLGRPGAVLPALRLAAVMAPLDEAVHASLIATLGAAGQQSEALSAFSAVRRRLVGELGAEPGPVLREAHRQVLTDSAAPAPARVTGVFVGREAELAALGQALTAAIGGAPGLVMVEGEPGSGKTRLLEEAAEQARRRGALVVWGRCLDGAGTPSMWPWAQALPAILAELPAAAGAGELRRLTDPARPAAPDQGTRFRLSEQVAAVIRQAAATRPTLLIIDDLQWADVASLELFGHLATRLSGRTVLVGAFRDRAPAPEPELAGLLATTAGVPGRRRVRLGPLSPAEVTDLLREEAGTQPDPAVVKSIHSRTAGNPFFVRELSRFVDENGMLAPEVPASVRDVVRDRTAGLDADARELLQAAAFIGRDVDPALLARVIGAGVPDCLARAEPLRALGLLAPVTGTPVALRFAHDLVREAIAGTTPSPGANHLHLRIADALQETGAGGAAVERLAHHLWSAGPLADPARTARALLHAGERAASTSALEAATHHLGSAARTARTAGLAELELAALTRLTAVAGMRAGYHTSAPGMLQRAEQLAWSLGREREATDLLFSRRAAHSQAVQLGVSGRLARRLADRGNASGDPVVRAYGLHAWGIHQWDLGHVGEAFRHLSRMSRVIGEDRGRRGEQPLRYDLRLMSAGMLAETTALHGDVPAARSMLDALEAEAGEDPYAITVAASFAARTATMAGDPGWARAAAERGIAADPGFSYTFFGTYARLARCWAAALTGDDPAGAAAEAEKIIIGRLLDPPRSNLHLWYGLLAEIWLAADRLDEATGALEQAGHFLEAHGQRYAEGLLLLLRARLLQARGESAATVRAAVRKARALAVEREAHLFAQRCDEVPGSPIK